MDDENAVVDAAQTEVEQVETVAAVVEPEKTPEPVFSRQQVEEEKAKVQSAFERKLAQERREREEISRRLEDAERTRQAEEFRRQQDEAVANARYLAELESLPDGQRLAAAHRQTQSEMARVRELERAANERYAAGVQGLKLSRAHDFAEQYGVDWRVLMDAKDENSMEAMAARLKAEKLEKEIESLKATPQKPPEEKIHLDSGITTARVTAKMTPAQLDAKYADGEISDADYRRQRKSLNY